MSRASLAALGSAEVLTYLLLPRTSATRSGDVPARADDGSAHDSATHTSATMVLTPTRPIAQSPP